MKVYFLICVFNLSGTDDADGDVLLALAVRQVVHGLRFTPAGLGLVVPLLHLQPDADDDGGATQQQHEDQNNPGAHCDPGKLAVLALCVLLSEVNDDRPLRWLGEQELAVEAAVAPSALAHVAVASLVAGGPVVAGVVLASAHRRAAVLPVVSWGAGAGVVVDPILTGPSIDAGEGGAIVHVVVTVPASEASLALAYVGVPQVNALGSISTRAGTAVIDFLFTVEPRITQWAAAAVSTIRVVSASPSIEARSISTSHCTQLTVFTIEAWGAGTGIAVLEIRAASTILARVGITFVDFNLAAGACVPRSARTSVAPLTGVGACGTILAWLVVSAVVQVLVAEKAAPAFLAVALPWLLTGTVQAAWVSDALITVPPLPTHSALAFPRFVAEAVLLVTPRQANRLSAVLALPAWVADLLATLSTGEVTEGVVTGPAEDRAAFPVVVLITHKAIGVLEVGAAAAVQVLGPLLAHRQVPLGGQAADEALGVFCGEVVGGVGVQSLDDEREGAGPGEAEGEADGVAEGGVGAARAVGDAEGVGAEDGGDGAAVGAGRLGGDAGLVVLQADAEEGLAVALLQPGASGAAPPAAVAVAEQPLLVDKLLQLQLEHPGAVNLAAAQQRREEGERQQEAASHGGGAALAFLPLCLRGGKGRVSLGEGERTEGPQPPRRAGGGTVPSPAFRRVSDCYPPTDAFRCSPAAADSSFGWQKEKKEKRGKKKKKKVLRLIC